MSKEAPKSGRMHQARVSISKVWQRLNVSRDPRHTSIESAIDSIPPVTTTSFAHGADVHTEEFAQGSSKPESESRQRRIRFAADVKKPKSSSSQQHVRYEEENSFDSRVYWAGFCKLCAGISREALESDGGYAHVADALNLRASGLNCDLCFLLEMALFVSARRYASDEEIPDVETAVEMLPTLIQKDGYVLKTPCPIILALYPGSMFRPRELHIGTRIQEKAGGLSQTTQSLAMDISLGKLLFHGEKEPVPLLPRLPNRDLFKRFGEQLWERSDNSEARENVPLPTLVLDMGNPLRKKHNYVDDDVNLAFGSGREGEYAALSYCWGGYRGFLTERASLRDRCSGINFDDLPKLFQDAVIVTRSLGIRYLWIDALCIIQDDKDDWDRESSRMASIYRNCKVRIAATAAKDPTKNFFPPKSIVSSVRIMHLEDTEGNSPDDSDSWGTEFLSSEDSEHSGDHRLSIEVGSDSERSGDHSLSVEVGSLEHGRANKRFITLPKYYAEDVDKARLNTRAWVLQERLLAPDTIHFC